MDILKLLVSKYPYCASVFMWKQSEER
jgi:hypothetical protein